MADRRAVVVGAGIGGLAAAAVLAHEGVAVTVLESAPTVGGKLRVQHAAGRAIDVGPTVFTLKPWFEALFERVGESLASWLAPERLTTLARHAWVGGARVDLLADLAATADAIGDFAGPAEARRFVAFSERSRRIFETLEAIHMRAPRPTPVALVMRAGWRGLPALWGISPFAVLMEELARAFTHPRLRQLFGRYATYCGSSPYAAPATLMLVAHAERAGVWRLPGGMHQVAGALAAIATARGAEVRCGAPVARIVVQRGRAAGVVLAGGEHLAADAVVFAGDVAALGAGLLGPAARKAAAPVGPRDRSLSAVAWSGVAEVGGFDLAHHTVFFSDDDRAEFEALFGQRRLPRAPTVYVCAQDRPRDEAAASGAERLFWLVNAPAGGDAGRPSLEEIETCERTTLQHLQRSGLRLWWMPGSVRRTSPAEFDALFPGSGGALYGRATHGWRASFQRPGSMSRLTGLWLAGGSVHPGPGLPMAATSGWLAAEAVLSHRTFRTSISPWPATATPGGTSTP